MGNKQTKVKKACMFCGNQGSSKEHIFPRWLGIRARDGDRYFYNSTVVRGSKNNSTIENESVAKNGSLADRHVRQVCAPCNNQWMSSKIETPAKAVVPMLTAGESTVITPQQQAILAAWATKIVMTNEFFPGGVVTIPEAERTYLMEKAEPPEDWVILICDYDGERYHINPLVYQASIIRTVVGTSYGPAQILRSATLAPGIQSHVQSTTFAVGRLLFIAVNNSAKAELWYHFRGLAAENMRMIWPPSGADITWPPKVSASEQDATLLGYSLFLTLRDMGIKLPPLHPETNPFSDIA